MQTSGINITTPKDEKIDYAITGLPAGSVEVKPKTQPTEWLGAKWGTSTIVEFYFPQTMDKPSQKKDDAAFDLPTAKPYVLRRGKNIIDTGLSIRFPPGVKGHLKLRSGLSFKRDIWVSLQGGVLDNGYRGPVHIMAFVHSMTLNGVEVDEIPIALGERLFQIEPETMPGWMIPGQLSIEYHVGAAPTDTDRGTDGFHSTGHT